LDTPAAVVDLDKLEANIERLQRYLNGHNIAGRPHIKTHKIPEIAHLQLRAGAVGITCQKIGEVEVMSRAGIRDIFLPYNIMGEAKLERLMLAARRTTLSVTADSEHTVRGLSRAAQRAGQTLPVLVEFDTGGKRCGVQTPEQAADLAGIIARSPGLHFGGLMTYPVNENSDPFVRAARELLNSRGVPIERVSVGGTPNMWRAHTFTEATEYRAGTYVYGDRSTVRSGAHKDDEVAFSVIATVISRPTADRGILDGGSKTFTSDLMKFEDYGQILEYPEASFYAQTEEHGHVDFSRCERKPEIGERVTVRPNHCCVVSNLFNQIVGVRQGQVEVVWPVAARGLIQ
jgi:D-serine deaminase-like pyridoxal phosphate-dependent protein